MRKSYISYSKYLMFFLLSPFVYAETKLPEIKIVEKNEYLNIAIPLSSYNEKEHEQIEIIGDGMIDGKGEKIQINIMSNRSPERKGVAHTEKACEININENFLRFLSKRLGIPLSSHQISPHTFDVVIEEGSLSKIHQTPLTLLLIDLERDENYSEWYLTVDLQKKILTLAEKNLQYREPFVNAFIKK